MRLRSLDLIRYGRFTDEALAFPAADCDFHLIVGPNEAGKSTLRRAIGDLLFGMPLHSDMDFRHAIAELRLGAVLESPGLPPLAFHRARGRKSLRQPDDSPLPDTALAEHLGGTTEGLFKRMFCLDLAGLIEGGHKILDDRDDMGQLLFQSAAGLADLGTLRDALAQEADTLYAPRKSDKRAFYVALGQLESARKLLRDTSVNTKTWTGALAEVERLQAAVDEAARRWQELSAQRQRLERLRRIAPRVAHCRELQGRLDTLADVPRLPEDAARRLADGEVTLAQQGATLALHREEAQRLQVQLAALVVDEAVLAQADAVQALAEQALACAHHARDIGRREDEVHQRLLEAASLGAQLGWPGDEAALRERLPSPLALKTLSARMQERGALVQARDSAAQALARARARLAQLAPEGQLGMNGMNGASDPAAAEADATPAPQTALQAALRQAQPLLADAPRERSMAGALTQARAKLDAALAALGAWRREPAALATLALPSEERLGALKAERAALAADAAAAAAQQARAQDQSRRAGLALAQFTAAQQVITPEDLRQARAARDALWGALKAGTQTLAQAAPPLDQAITQADTLADRLRDQAGQVAELMRLRQEAEREAAAAQAASTQAQQAAQQLAALDAAWAAQTAALGLDGLPLLDCSGWAALRRRALEAAEAVAEREQALAAHQQALAQASAGLSRALQDLGVTPPPTAPERDAAAALASLAAQAEHWLAERLAGRARALAQAEQLALARTELAHQQQAGEASATALQVWQARWQAAVQAASLGTLPLPGREPEDVQPALDLVARLRELLAQVDELRVQRIQTMRRDLADFDAAAEHLHAALRSPAASADDGTLSADRQAWARTQLERLQRARDAHKERARLQAAAQHCATALREAEAAQAATLAALAPLHAQAQTTEPGALRERIAASDLRRQLEAERATQRSALLEAGDGLPLDALQAEHDGADLAGLKTALDDLESRLQALGEERNRLAVSLSQAAAARNQIHGGDAAARAESQRLEALSTLGDTAERYLQVSTGHRLLRWAVDRYRERRQGPLLQRASSLFAQLTLGGFSRLSPDYEHPTPRLMALRASGERVAIDGLSEGTRDQLFLALRLAALEMHIASDRPLPFIADDLFVNFHDSRSRAGLAALGALAHRTQVIFLTHHDHLVDVARECVGDGINVVRLGAA